MVAAALDTVDTACARCTASTGRVGFCEPNVPPACTMIRLVPSSASWTWRAPLALSVSPTAPTIAATPIIGAEHDEQGPHLASHEPGPGDIDQIA